MSISNECVVSFYNKGYRVVHNELYSPEGVRLSKYVNSKGYFTHTFYYKKRSRSVALHKFVAYQKFGNKLFEEGIQVRHLDGNPVNNFEDNIAIGTRLDNIMDIPADKRRKFCSKNALKATTKNRKFPDKVMRKIKAFYRKCRSYKKTMEKFKISSKGTLHYMLNKKYVTVLDS